MQDHTNAAAGQSKLSALAEHMRSLNFTVQTGVQFEGQTFDIAARKGRFELLTRVEYFFCLAQFGVLDLASLKSYSLKCYDYAAKNRRVPLSLFCTVSYSVALVHGVDDAVVSTLRKREPIQHGSSFEFPIVWDLSTGLLCYSEATSELPDVRGLNWDIWRKTALEVLAPVARPPSDPV
jgi:hypothetical protein